jgi:hypothetical protein
MALFGFRQRLSFTGTREIASDCNEAVGAIIRHEIPRDVEFQMTQKEALELKHYRFKTTIWNKILTAREFESFDSNEYFRLLEIYKDSRQTADLLSMNPVSIEQKLALIESIQIRYSYFKKLPGVQEDIENLNVYKLKKLEKLLKKFDLSKKLTRESLNEFAADFFLIVKGPPPSLLEYFMMNKTEKMNQRMFRLLEEDMLIRGLKNTIERIPERNFQGNSEKAAFYIHRVMKYKAWRYLVIPYDLPWIDRVKISDQLLGKIFLDGLDAHQSELILELKNQNAIDLYEQFRKVYRPVAFGVGFYFYYSKYQKKHQEEEDVEDKENEEAKKKFLEDFKKLQDSINAADTKVKSDDEIKEEQFQRVLKKMKDQYHEDPSPEDKAELRRKIFGS